jgi:hypothetical protein
MWETAYVKEGGVIINMLSYVIYVKIYLKQMNTYKLHLLSAF